MSIDSFAPKGPKQTSPGQSAAPPWVWSLDNRQALKGRNQGSVSRPFRAFALSIPPTQGGAALCPGLYCCRTFGAKCASSPLVIRAMPTVVALIAFALCTLSAHAALDPETKKPYQLQIVLNIGANRLFTPLFQEQLQRDLANHLKLTFGALAHIEIKRTHELLRDIEARGLEQSLERFDKVSIQTTHFVLLDYAAGSYRIQTRFHDGMTAQAGPLTR
jgi:hypothetical protein